MALQLSTLFGLMSPIKTPSLHNTIMVFLPATFQITFPTPPVNSPFSNSSVVLPFKRTYSTMPYAYSYCLLLNHYHYVIPMNPVIPILINPIPTYNTASSTSFELPESTWLCFKPNIIRIKTQSARRSALIAS